MAIRNVLLAGVMTSALSLGAPAPIAAAPGPVIGAVSIGMTVNGIARTGAADTVPTFAGAIRLWDSGVSWRRIQPSRSTPIDWTRLDLAIKRARENGMRDILYVLGNTPQWASVPSSAESGDLYGPGSASHPAHDSDYLDFLRAVLTRYKGVISGYEIWNESNNLLFYRGTATQLARLTVKARALIRSIDPAAKIVGPSWYLRNAQPQRLAQMRALAKVGWPIDVLSVHSYPAIESGPTERVRLLREFKAQAAALGTRSMPIWDTETNFGNELAGRSIRSYTGTKASAWIAQAHLDSFRYGIKRTYWYSWDTRFLGIDLTDARGRPTSAAKSLSVLSTWLVGYRWAGCATKRGIIRCKVPSVSGVRRTIVFTRDGTTRLGMPKGARSVCSLSGACRKVTKGKRITVSITPRLVTGGRL